MNQFRFRLQNIQKLRQRLRDEAADSLRQAQLAIDTLNSEVEALNSELSGQVQLQSQASRTIIDTQRVLESQRYQLHLLGNIQSLREKVSLVQQEYERRRQTLIQREQDVRALERLGEAQQLQWQHTQSVRQQHRLDEWAGFRYWNSTDSGKPERELGPLLNAPTEPTTKLDIVIPIAMIPQSDQGV
jgi:flagellar export protein FliJ